MIILKGDLLETPFEIIAHQVNCQGKMGSGVAKQIAEKFPYVYEEYVKAIKDYGAGEMFGKAQVVNTNSGKKFIFNIFGQYDYGYDGRRYTDYDAFRCAFQNAIDIYRDYRKDWSHQITITIPYKIGCDRGGGDWSVVKQILEKIEEDCNVIFVAYKLDK